MLPEHFGDGLLMRNGFTLVSVGWEFDVGPCRTKREATDCHDVTAHRSSKPSLRHFVLDARGDGSELQRRADVSRRSI